MKTAIKTAVKNRLDKTLNRYGMRVKSLKPFELKPLKKPSKKKIDITQVEGFGSISRRVIDDKRTFLRHDRLHILWQALQNVVPTENPIAEVGTYKGGSAYFLCSALKYFNCPSIIHICDTFEGHVVVNPDLDGGHVVGNFSDSLATAKSVSAYLSEFDNHRIHKGDFQKSCRDLADLTFAFAHIDVDVYPVTKSCLAFFDERLQPGGILVVDDYGNTNCKGAKQAVDEFVEKRRKDYRMFHLETMQALLVDVR